MGEVGKSIASKLDKFMMNLAPILCSVTLGESGGSKALIHPLVLHFMI